MSDQPVILVIDDQLGQTDDPMIPERYGRLSYRWLKECARNAQGRYTAQMAMRRVRREMPNLDIILLDVMFGQEDSRLGAEILEGLRDEFPTVPILMFTSLASAENRELVVQCMELGSNEFVEKTPSATHMNSILRVYTDPLLDFALYGNSPAIRALRASIARIAFSGETSVLAVGESGSGKELVARAVHRQGPRRTGPFVAKNCANAESQLLDSELFGHEKGSFTGATNQRIGLIEEANGGVLFLDEVSDMPVALQAKLLRTLETRSFRRLGGSADLTSQFQLICATNRTPDDLLKNRQLREDFYYRISTMVLKVPPLRDHIDDIPILANLFLKRFRLRGGASYPGKTFDEEFLEKLRTYAWPGNIRELRNTVERAVILSHRIIIGVSELPEFRSLSGESASYESSAAKSTLPAKASEWPIIRLTAELGAALEAKERVRTYKGNHWKAEFMRLLYPACKASNAKGFDDLVKRLTQGPWGCPDWKDHPEIVRLLEELRS